MSTVSVSPASSTENRVQTIRGADLFVRCLRELGVDTVFGYPGGAIMPIYDALPRSGIT
ncbi:MAG: hypothetical protein EA418_14315, partial [Wenzhouxiangellaceae bacterium]